MERMTFIKLAETILREEKRPLSIEEMWNIAVEKKYDKEFSKLGKTPWATLAARVYVEIQNHKNSNFYKVSLRPSKFFLKDLSTEGIPVEEIPEKEKPKKEAKFEFLESDLHPFLTYFSQYFLKAFTKTINHSKSGKKNYGEWVHPDMVGFYFPIEEWNSDVLDFSNAIRNTAIKIFSFELKRELNFSNLRESFFQAVSNSTWANEGYLVASEISKDEEFRDEVRRLVGSFGIGIIELDIIDPDSSSIIFPAKQKEYLDWETMNKLADMNSDFLNFLQSVRKDLSNKEIRNERYNEVLTKEKLVKAITRKK
jgi:hypothetical protein